ncbi:GTP cyclohydrolase I [Patulibacter medicamentivorans]|uniref:GTP cyclohydrolase 1 n=1 Tax=Patulibacter medicamentivorans TaxID=1097667 RepID=H0E3X7_9ACTN|nr:GTP cyclohydrolase I [Patulibacter medicamentivorans]EHN11625.1 GTP cyclohydrolase I [Patulibacter medicamentivorans]
MSGSQDLAALPARGERTEEGIDLARAERATAELLRALGADPAGDEEALRQTPRRVAAAFGQLLTPRPFDATTFPNDEGYDELVVVHDIPFRSLCMHHLLPFHGVAHVGYVPGERIVGLSKLARVVEWFSSGLQTQERLTAQVADWLQDELAPVGVGVALEAEHLCMTLRGVGARGAATTTLARRGAIRDDPDVGAEFRARVADRGGR